MKLQTINHKLLSQLARDGVIRNATAVADGEKWNLVVEYARVQKIVESTNSRNPRTWSKLDTLHKYLMSLDIRTWDVDARGYFKRGE